jgi:hypothetical protein
VYVVAIPFIDDDSGFERWRDDHPHGFVVNHNRVPSPSYLVLHRADCVCLRTTRGSNWTSTYGKTCAETLEDIEACVWRKGMAYKFTFCSFCDPPNRQTEH